MPFDRGDVILALFPDSNLRTSKRRPVLVVQRDNLNSGLKQVVVAMITSNMARAGHPSRVEVRKSSQHGSAMGLLTDSVIVTDNLVTVLESEIDRSIGKLTDLSDVDNALRHTLGL